MDTDFIPPQDSGIPGTMVTTPLKSPPPQDYAKKLVSRRRFLFSAHLNLFLPYLLTSPPPLFSSLFLPSLFSTSPLSSFLPPFSFFIPLFSFSSLSPSFLVLYTTLLYSSSLSPLSSLSLTVSSSTGRGPSQEV